MKILVITNLFYPDRGGGASVFSDLCYGLVERGYDVTVFAAYPYYPEWKDKTGRNSLKISKEMHAGVKIERYALFIPKNPSKLLSRVLYEGSFFLSLLRSVKKKQRYDLVMVYCPLLSAVAFAVIRKLFYKKPLWINIQDIPADAAEASGISHSRWFNYFGKKFQNYIFNKGDVWSTISPVMVNRLKRYSNSQRRDIYYLPNWLNASLENEIEALPNNRDRKPRIPLKLLYAGNIGKKQDLLGFCVVMKNLKFNFEFCIYGNGGESEKIKQWVETQKDGRFSFGEFLNESAFAAALNETDFFVITEKSGVGGSFIPSKLIPAIASGTPILAVCDQEGPLGQEMAGSQLGLILSWDNLGKIKEQLNYFTKHHEGLIEIRDNCLHRSLFFRRDRIIDSFDKKIRDLCDQQFSNRINAREFS